jgi:hypothetical protein
MYLVGRKTECTWKGEMLSVTGRRRTECTWRGENLSVPGIGKDEFTWTGERLSVPGRKKAECTWKENPQYTVLEWKKLNLPVREKSSLYIEGRKAECNWKGERLTVPGRGKAQ